MGISLAGEKAWAVSEQLPPGTYVMRPAPGGVERDQSTGGNEQVKIDWRVAAGEYTGSERRDWVTFTQASMGRVVQLIEACGEQVPQQDFASYGELADWVAGMLKKDNGPLVEAVVRLKPDRKDSSKEWPEIVGYRRPGPESDVPGSASDVTGGPGVGANGNAQPLPF